MNIELAKKQARALKKVGDFAGALALKEQISDAKNTEMAMRHAEEIRAVRSELIAQKHEAVTAYAHKHSAQIRELEMLLLECASGKKRSKKLAQKIEELRAEQK